MCLACIRNDTLGPEVEASISSSGSAELNHFYLNIIFILKNLLNTYLIEPSN